MYGTPVVGADIGGIPEIMRDGETGVLFKSGDAGDLRRKIEMIWNDRTLNERYCQDATSMVFDTVDEYVQKLMKVYKA